MTVLRSPQRRQFTCAPTLLACAITTVVSIQANAGGFALVEHGASGLGNAYAGAAAVSADGSTAWFNAAGMTELGERKIALAAHVLSTNTEFENRGTTLEVANLGGAEISGSDTATAGTTSVLPNFYYTAPINDEWFYGLSIGAPFGSSTEYEPDWVGRYTTVKSGISVIDFNPSFAWKMSDTVRFGFGVSVQLLSAELSSAVDSGAVCLAVYSDPAVNDPEACLEPGVELVPGFQPNDGSAEITGDSTGFGFNVGALFLPRAGTKVGLAFRSGVEHELDGTGDFDTNENLRVLLDEVGSTLLSDSDATAEVSLPPTIQLSAAQMIGDKLELLGDITWTGWSSFDELRVVYANEQQPDTVSTQDWEDVFRYSVGVNYDLNTSVRLRGGLAYDEEAIPGPERRTARIPGNDRTWLSLGLGYRVGNSLSFDLGYARLFLEETAIDNQNLEATGGSVVRGTYDSSVNIFSAQLNWEFN